MTQLQFPESRYASRLFLCGRPPAGQMLTSSDQVPRLAHSSLQFHVHLRINTVEIPCANWFYVLLLIRVERHQYLQFYVHGSVHRNTILIRSNKMQQYAGIYLLQNHSTCFGCPWHPSSGVHKTVIAASGTGHSI